jgi:uncharacterized repeat protein (TIGR04076 family)
MTNNQAEYNGLLEALRLLADAGADAVEINSDSELLVRQILGEYRVKSPDLKPLFARAEQGLQVFSDWRIKHVRREKNTEADGLANQAMDARRDVVVTDRLGLGKADPPPKTGKLQSSSAKGVIEAVVMRGPKRGACPARVRKGQVFVFSETTPEGLCVEACATLIEAVRSLADVGSNASGDDVSMTVSCPKGDCGAKFEVRPANRGG